MGASETRHPVIVDTDALISVSNTSLWDRVVESLRLTTTNVCVHELRRHVEEHSAYAPEGTRERWVHGGSEAALEPFEDEANDAFSVVTSVPRPHGRDAGERSVKREVEQHPEGYTFAVLMDRAGRDAINRVFDEQAGGGVAVAPSYLLYLLYREERCSKAEFCRACGELLEGEGWTSYAAVQALWEEIPVDCSAHLDSELLP